MYILAGLGNPTLRYRHTRHNAGFDALDYIAKKERINVKKKDHFSLMGEGEIAGNKIILVKPQTYMNKSGESLRSLVSYYGIDPSEELIVLVDDIMLDAGTIRVRQKGSAGGHNGLKDIIRCLNTEEFTRVRIGVGKMPPEADQIKYVTTRAKGEDMKKIMASCDDVYGAVKLIVSGSVQKAMNDYNGKSKGK